MVQLTDVRNVKKRVSIEGINAAFLQLQKRIQGILDYTY
jgi:hypothetical protein